MKLITKPITKDQLKKIAKKSFGNLVKAVVDIEKGIMVIDAELHADQESALLQKGSKQTDLWGINLYPDMQNSNWIEFDSMINLRPYQNNLTRGVDNPKIRQKIIEVVNKLIK